MNSTGTGIFTLDPITLVSLTDANASSDFASRGAYSFKIGAVPAGSSGSVTNATNFTNNFGGFNPTTESLNVSGTAVYLNMFFPLLPTIWTDTGASPGLWVTSGNWSAGTPGAGNNAIFNGTGTTASVSLSNALQSINTITFDTASAISYTIGQPASSDALKFSLSGAINVNSTVVNPQTFNALIELVSGLTITNNSGVALTLNNNIQLASGGSLAGLTFAGLISAATTSVGGTISGINALTQSGLGTVLLGGNLSFTGPVQVSAGTLTLTGNNSGLNGAVTVSGATA